MAARPIFLSSPTARILQQFKISLPVTISYSTITITPPAGGGIGTWTLETTAGLVLNQRTIGTQNPTTVGASPATYTVTGANGDTALRARLDASGSPGTTMAQVVTCTPAKSASSDSQKLRAVQLQLTKTVAANSGAAISGAIDGAISDAFSASGGSPINAGANGVRLNLAAEPQSDVAHRADEAFAALGYAGNVYAKAPPRIDREWSAWIDVRGTGFNRNDAVAATHGDQVNVTGGLGYKLP